MDIGLITLVFTGVSFIGYGFLAMLSPGRLVKIIGYSIEGGDSKIEFKAMYGGLEIGLGVFCLLGVFDAAYYWPALMAVVLTVGGLFIVRLAATLAGQQKTSRFTHIALVFEAVILVLALLSFWLEIP